jgi:putative transposase
VPNPIIKQKPLGRLIGAFKTVSTKKINILRDALATPLWQRNYYEHIIRN